MLLVTHYERLLELIVPDRVHVLAAAASSNRAARSSRASSTSAATTGCRRRPRSRDARDAPAGASHRRRRRARLRRLDARCAKPRARGASPQSGWPTPRRETWRYTDLEAARGPTLSSSCRAHRTAARSRAVERVLARTRRSATRRGSPRLRRRPSDREPRRASTHRRHRDRAISQTRWNALDSRRSRLDFRADHPLAALNTAFAQHGAVAPRARRRPDRRARSTSSSSASGAPDLAPQPRIVHRARARRASSRSCSTSSTAGEPSGLG